MTKENERFYYVEYSRKMVTGNRLQLRAVWKESELAWYFMNYSPRYDYIIDSARIATDEEIKEFSKDKYIDNEYYLD